jgi:hypothetical protein
VIDVNGKGLGFITMPDPSESHYGDAVALLADIRRPACAMNAREAERHARRMADNQPDDDGEWHEPMCAMGAGRIMAEAASKEADALEHCASAAERTLAFTRDMTINCAARAFARAASLRAEYARRLGAMRATNGGAA